MMYPAGITGLPRRAILCLLVMSIGWAAMCRIAFAQERRALGNVTLDLAGESGQTGELELYSSSHALLIGISDYTAGWPDLPGVIEDIDLVREALETHGFEVETVLDPSGDELRRAVNSFITRTGRDADARLLIYYAGHGHTRKLQWGGDMGYLVPADCPRPDRDIAGFSQIAIDMEQVEVWAKRIESKHALFLFDSCFSGSIFALSRAVPASISLKTARPIRQFITSGSADQEVPDASDFRREFVRALSGEGDTNGDGYVTGSELGEFLYDRVTNYSSGAQTPQYGKIRNPMLDRGDFVFQIRRAPEPTPEVLEVPEFSADDLLARARAREQAEVSRREYRQAAEQAYGTLQKIDANDYIDARDKAAKWKEYLDKFEDAGYEIAQARARHEFWLNWTPPTPTPTPPPKEPQPGETKTLDLGGGISLRLVWIPKGAFTMGSSEGEPQRFSNEGPQTHVTLTSGFWIGETEVTQAQWQAVMDTNPARHQGPDRPVEQVSWGDAMAFCQKLSERAGIAITLPTEAQWEYACRAGTTTPFYFGSDETQLEAHAWFMDNANKQTQNVRRKRPNPWGLYDMHGNVWEWCLDLLDTYPGGRVEDWAQIDSGRDRIIRGGSWGGHDMGVRAAIRIGYSESTRNQYVGFRVVSPLKSPPDTGRTAQPRRDASPATVPDAGDTSVLDLGNGVTMRLAWIPPSKSQEGFWLGETEVTQAQWTSIMKDNPSHPQGDSYPVVRMTWNDAVEFCSALSKFTGELVVLPASEQWEYACRAGTQTKYHFGDSTSQLDEYGWYSENTNRKLSPVRQKKPNPWGLYDMHGNVWEWTSTPDGSKRVKRGGGWDSQASYCTSSITVSSDPEVSFSACGFRVAVLSGRSLSTK